jgi:pimeloyl-ACP methyl ester carboxylesterase
LARPHLLRGRPDLGSAPAAITGTDGDGGVPGDTTIRPLAERDHNVVHWAEFDRGGHFAAMEAPDLLVRDVREFFRPLRSGFHGNPALSRVS